MDYSHCGRTGEDLAAAFLEGQGYQIEERNYRKSFGEIDVVARDGETLCFIEVKTRLGDDYGHPFEAVTPSKQRTIRRLAAVYLMEHDISGQLVRFDVAAVFPQEDGALAVELLKNAF